MADVVGEDAAGPGGTVFPWRRSALAHALMIHSRRIGGKSPFMRPMEATCARQLNHTAVL